MASFVLGDVTMASSNVGRDATAALAGGRQSKIGGISSLVYRGSSWAGIDSVTAVMSAAARRGFVALWQITLISPQKRAAARRVGAGR
jgi:hypothetical protein